MAGDVGVAVVDDGYSNNSFCGGGGCLYSTICAMYLW